MNNEQTWKAVLGEMEVSLSRAHFVTWFKDTFISSFENDKIILCVPNAFVKKWLEEKYHKNILNALKSVTKLDVKEIIYKIELKKIKDLSQGINGNNKSKTKESNTFFTEVKSTRSLPSTNNSFSANRFGLNPKYLFENFVVGKGNELAHAACLAVVNNLGKSYNPLFIYGGVGLGKTHLMQAVGNAIAKKVIKSFILLVKSLQTTIFKPLLEEKLKSLKTSTVM
jgi:chromosomal replication initiator protein